MLCANVHESMYSAAYLEAEVQNGAKTSGTNSKPPDHVSSDPVLLGHLARGTIVLERSSKS